MHWTFYLGVFLVVFFLPGNIIRAIYKLDISGFQFGIVAVGVCLVCYSILGITY